MEQERCNELEMFLFEEGFEKNKWYVKKRSQDRVSGTVKEGQKSQELKGIDK